MELIKRNSTLKGDMKNVKFVEIFPSKIILVKMTDQSFSEGRIVVKNLTQNYVIYKILTRQSAGYAVSPSVYFIKPSNSVTINVKHFEKV